jgi:hypothetical protein
MAEEELTRFALVLRESNRIRMQVTKDEAAARADGQSDLQPPSVEGEQSSGPAVIAAA